MKLVLATKFSQDYWRRRNATAPFNNQTNKQIIENNWQLINKNCPMLGIGYYKSNVNKNISGDEHFEYIKILGITKNNDNEFLLSYDFVINSNTSSNSFEPLLSSGQRYLFNVFDDFTLDNILKNLNESFPTEIIDTIQTNNNVRISPGDSQKPVIKKWEEFN